MIRLATQPNEPRLVILSLSRVELRAAIRRRLRSRELSVADAEAALASFSEHLGSVFIVQPVTEALLERALTLIDARDLRAYDAIQLAGCLMQAFLHAGSLATFVSADRRLLEAARAEGLPVLDPAA